jgi:hypothetical protein
MTPFHRRSLQDRHSLTPSFRSTPKACVNCRNRKVKCDRQLPCSTCKRWGIQNCVYPSPVRISPRPKRAESQRKNRDEPDKLLLERLRKLEIMVKNFGGSVTTEDSLTDFGTPTNVELDDTGGRDVRDDAKPRNSPCGADGEKGVGRLVVKSDRSRYMSIAFWASAGDVCDLTHPFSVRVRTASESLR